VAEPGFAEWLLLPQEVTDELGRSLGIAYFPLGHLGGLLVTRVLGQMPEQEYTLLAGAERAPQEVLEGLRHVR
jgi:hypothetical protein